MKTKWKVIITLISVLTIGAVIGAYFLYMSIFRPKVEIDNKAYPIMGIDISAHNGNIDFGRVEADNIAFVFMKATEGATFKDSRFEYNYSTAKKTQLKLGVYHFFRFDINGTLQGMNLLNSIQNKEIDFPIVIDLEEHSNPDTPTQSVVIRLQEMIDYLAKYKYDVIIYTNNNGYKRFLQPYFADYPLWLCRFTTPEQDMEWTFWQFSHWGTVDGVEGDVDLNIFNGGVADFRSFIGNL